MREEAGLPAEKPTPQNWLLSEDGVHAELKRWIEWEATYTIKEYEYAIELDDVYTVPGQIQYGDGDFLLEKVGEKTLLVVEVKHIKEGHGRNACAKRTMARKKVRKQALRFARLVGNKYRDYKIVACIYTNECAGLQSWDSVSQTWNPFSLESAAPADAAYNNGGFGLPFEPLAWEDPPAQPAQDLPEDVAKENFKRKDQGHDHDHESEPKPKKCATRLCFAPW